MVVKPTASPSTGIISFRSLDRVLSKGAKRALVKETDLRTKN